MRPFFFVLLALCCASLARPVAANQRDVVPGEFYFYDYTLDKKADRPDNQYGIGEAKLLEAQGRAELFEWNDGAGRCLQFTPEKIGDSISFGIHIGGVTTQTSYAVKTIRAYFNNEGIYEFLVDDKVVGEQHDCSLNDKWKHGDFLINPGDYKITYRYVGKNPKSGGTVMNLIWLDIG